MAVNIEPVTGLVNYVNFVKPYHTKILEVLVEYIHSDCIDVTITEDFHISFGMPDSSLLSLWGWTEEQAKKFFNCDFVSYQITNVSSAGGYWEVQGDVSSEVQVGDVLLHQEQQTAGFIEYTVTSVTLISSSLTVNSLGLGSPQPGCGTAQNTYSFDAHTTCPPSSTSNLVTRISVNETIPIGTPIQGVLYPYKSTFTDSYGNVINTACWTYDSFRNIYTRNTGIVIPSNEYIEKNINCEGYGYIFQQAVGSPPELPDGLSTSNVIVGASSTYNYFEIQNNVGVPSVITTWADGFVQGATFSVTGSSGNDSIDYTVQYSEIIEGSPDILRIHIFENVPSNIADGTLQLRPWGYDEPSICIDQAQTQIAETKIAENMEITINDININLVQGWDTYYWDMGGYDGGSFTYLVTFT